MKPSISEHEELREASGDHLELDGADLVDMCETYQTPLFIFDERRLRENYHRFTEAFAKHYPKVAVCYSVKSNRNLALCTILREEGAFAEAVSALDLHVALKAGFPSQRIILDGLHKPEELLREAVRLDLLVINAESFSELELLNQIAGKEGRRPSVGLRVSSCVRVPYLEKLYCNPESRFGFPFEETVEVFEKARELENLNLCGIMIHPHWGMRQFLHLVRRIRKELNIKIEYVNLGGGFHKATSRIGATDLAKDAVRQSLGMKSNLDRSSRERIDIEEEGLAIASEVESALGDLESTLFFEPGRYLVHDTGFLALKAVLVKRVAGQTWIVADGGTDLVPDFLERREIRIANRPNAQPEEIVNIVGPDAIGHDFVTLKKCLPGIKVGDYIILSNVGAYTLSRSTQFLYPRPAAVLVRPSGKVVLIRQRETCEDVVRMDRL